MRFFFFIFIIVFVLVLQFASFLFCNLMFFFFLLCRIGFYCMCYVYFGCFVTLKWFSVYFCVLIFLYFVCRLPFGIGGVVNELVVAGAEFELLLLLPLLLWLFSSPSSVPLMGGIVYGSAQFGRFVIIMWLHFPFLFFVCFWLKLSLVCTIQFSQFNDVSY